jgi:hypothetical protein
LISQLEKSANTEKQPIVGSDVSRAEFKSAKIGCADILETRLWIITKNLPACLATPPSIFWVTQK